MAWKKKNWIERIMGIRKEKNLLPEQADEQNETETQEAASPEAEQSVTDNSTTEESITEESVKEESITEESVKEESITEESITEESVKEESITEESITEESITEESITEESITGESLTGESEQAAETVAEPADEFTAETVEEAAEESAEEPEEEAEASEPVKEIIAGTDTMEETAEEADAEEKNSTNQENDPEETAGQVSLDSLEPADVFRFFREISAIPHGSFNTDGISDYLENFAKERGLEYIRDELGNLIISRPGSAGFEDAEPVALQGHVDMVCEKEEHLDLDMDTQPITLVTDGVWLSAEGTTLGGDDGIAVAIMLALLDDDSLKCPPLECIFTVNEEVGLLGAAGIDLSSLRSRRLINIDSEKEGIITASCGGGAELVCTLPAKRKEKTGMVVTLSVSGLNGGHSGDKIGEGRANAVLILARLLHRLSGEGKYFLCSLEGGKRDNAIPRNARAEILFKGKIRRKEILAAVKSFEKEVKAEYKAADPALEITVTFTGKDMDERRSVLTRKDSMRVVNFLMILPNGVIDYMPGYRDIPRTSLSLGIAEMSEEGFRTHSLIRSNVNSRKHMVMDKVTCLAEVFGASTEVRGMYPAWEFVTESDFRATAKEIYKQVTGKEAVVDIIHAGLECGILSSKVPGLECISIGPDIEDIHTPAERLNIESSARTYRYVRGILKAFTEKEKKEEI